MAKKSTIEKNNKRLRLATFHAEKRRSLKAIIMNKSLPLDERFSAQMKLSQMPRDTAITRYRNRCELTGRSRGVYSKFKLSRICIRELAGKGLLPGVIKASW